MKSLNQIFRDGPTTKEMQILQALIRKVSNVVELSGHSNSISITKAALIAKMMPLEKARLTNMATGQSVICVMSRFGNLSYLEPSGTVIEDEQELIFTTPSLFPAFNVKAEVSNAFIQRLLKP